MSEYVCRHEPEHDTHGHLWDDYNEELLESEDRYDCDPRCSVFYELEERKGLDCE